MLKKITLICLCLSLSLAVLGQKWNYNLRGGISIGAPFTTDIAEGAKGWLGLAPHGGVGVCYAISPRCELSFQAAYVGKNARFFSPLNDTITDTQPIFIGGVPIDTAYIKTLFSGTASGYFKNKYIEFSFNTAYKTRNWKFQLGIFAAYLAKGENKIVANGTIGFAVPPTYTTREIDNSDALRIWDYGLLAGMERRVYKSLSMYFNLSYGFPNVYAKPTEGTNVKLNNAYIYLGFLYSI